jgi:hypothetical protein
VLAVVEKVPDARDFLLGPSVRRVIEQQLEPKIAARLGAPPALKAPPKNVGGRPTQHDWDAVWIEIVRLANTPDGLPERNKLQNHLAEFVSAWAKVPDDRALREKLARLYKQL